LKIENFIQNTNIEVCIQINSEKNINSESFLKNESIFSENFSIYNSTVLVSGSQNDEEENDKDCTIRIYPVNQCPHNVSLSLNKIFYAEKDKKKKKNFMLKTSKASLTNSKMISIIMNN
jgi:hypothetical protein